MYPRIMDHAPGNPTGGHTQDHPPDWAANQVSQGFRYFLIVTAAPRNVPTARPVAPIPEGFRHRFPPVSHHHVSDDDSLWPAGCEWILVAQIPPCPVQQPGAR